MDKWRINADHVVYFEAVIFVVSLGLIIMFGYDLYLETFSNFETQISKESQRLTEAQEFNQDRNDSEHHIDQSEHKTWVVGVPIPTFMCWIAYVIFLVATLVRFWLLIGLSKATANRTPQKEAIRRARIWTNVTLKLMFLEGVIAAFSYGAVLSTIGPLKNLSSILFCSLWFDFCMKSECLSVVHKFINELQNQAPVCTDV